MLKADTPLRYVKGVGPRRAEAFGEAGYSTVEDLLYVAPFRYEDRRAFARIADLRPGGPECTLDARVAEGRLIWNSLYRRDLWRSEQGVLMSARDGLRGRQVFGERWTHELYFVVDGLVGAVPRDAADAAAFLRDSRPGDYLFASRQFDDPRLVVTGSNGRYWLYRRAD